MKEFQKNLKVGDRVFVSRTFPGHDERTVSRKTKTMVILDDGRRFSIRDGTQVGGGSWHLIRLVRFTDELSRAERHRKIALAIAKRSGFPRLLELDMETLIKIWNLVK